VIEDAYADAALVPNSALWVQPRLVANFEFFEWTDSNHVRHIKFVATRFDKEPRTVVLEC
jgi:bifunctional non-homologous end joining protein LigD